MTACKCGAEWSGKRLEHCTACHETFTGTRAGDMHRTGSYFPLARRCLSADEMRDKGMRPNARGVWTTGASDPRWQRYTLDESVLIPGTPIFGCPVCWDPWESEPSCEHYAATKDTA